MNTYDILKNVTITLLVLNGWKSIIGFHFPWEKCQCCGKPWREHKDGYKPTKEDRTRRWLQNKLDDHRVAIQYPEPGKQYSKWLHIGRFDVTYNANKLDYEVYVHKYGKETVVRDWVYTDMTSIGTAAYLWRKIYGKTKHTPTF